MFSLHYASKITSIRYYLSKVKWFQPGKTDSGCSTCPDRIGGGYGGNWEGSGPFERVDGGEIIEGLQRVAITCGRPAVLILLVIFFELRDKMC